MYNIIKNALVNKGKCIGMAIGLTAGMAIGYVAASRCMCSGNSSKSRSNSKSGKNMKDKLVKCGNDIVEGVVDTAGKIRNTMYCDCDDNGACRIPDQDKQDTDNE